MRSTLWLICGLAWLSGCDSSETLGDSMVAKSFKLSAEQIRPLAEGHGACFASDMITVEGRRVAFMYREAPDRDGDSGWRFMSGYESAAYMDDARNHGVYDVNTIANYDPDIIPFLNAPEGSAFERRNGSGPFEAVEFEAPE